MITKTTSTKVSPLKSALDDLAFLRKNFREIVHNYSSRIEGDIAQVCETISAEAQNKKVSLAHLQDVRDILTMIHTLETNPKKGRRRDFKKIERLIDEIRTLVDNW